MTNYFSTPTPTLGEWHIFRCACLKHKWTRIAKYIELNYFTYFLIMFFTNRGYLAVVAWNDCQQVLAARWLLFVHWMLRKNWSRFSLCIYNSIHSLPLVRQAQRHWSCMSSYSKVKSDDYCQLNGSISSDYTLGGAYSFNTLGRQDLTDYFQQLEGAPVFPRLLL